MAFLRAAGGENHHDLGLFEVGDGAPQAPRGATGLYHLAWEVPTLQDLATARAAGALGVRVEDTESGRVYLADWAALDAHGYTFDRGYGRQIALPLRYWQLEGAPAPLVQETLFA